MIKLKHIVLMSVFLSLSAPVLIAFSKEDTETKTTEAKISYYTCPMHPEIHENHPGKCPKCGMDLVPVHEGE